LMARLIGSDYMLSTCWVQLWWRAWLAL